MPIYEFHCPKCGLDFEDLIFTTKITRTVCPNCEAKNCQKIMSAATLHSKSSDGVTKGSSTSGCGSCAGGSACATCGH
ncbi:MAG: hypothetical protein AMR96_02365 [Candidatus Adiutrix intracellularis]|nr:MAG: hypothetical protein AMR96_02365 [Candidatus Adiutrix intracellularis]MDR2827032.1 zinc ribbon domain-containing protein [Candidatus Adiutrix intracellularis]